MKPDPLEEALNALCLEAEAPACWEEAMERAARDVQSPHEPHRIAYLEHDQPSQH